MWLILNHLINPPKPLKNFSMAMFHYHVMTILVFVMNHICPNLQYNHHKINLINHQYNCQANYLILRELLCCSGNLSIIALWPIRFVDERSWWKLKKMMLKFKWKSINQSIYLPTNHWKFKFITMITGNCIHLTC